MYHLSKQKRYKQILYVRELKNIKNLFTDVKIKNSGTKQGCTLLPLLLNFVLQVLTSEPSKRNKGHRIEKKALTASLFAGIIMCTYKN